MEPLEPSRGSPFHVQTIADLDDGTLPDASELRWARPCEAQGARLHWRRAFARGAVDVKNGWRREGG